MAEHTQILALGLHTTFASLRHSNFRNYFAAQIGSNIGSWIQITAENWLVLQLAHSGLALGITSTLQLRARDNLRGRVMATTVLESSAVLSSAHQ
jgi:hypothetical protein